MADIEHKNVTDPNIHEPKGVATATSGEVYVADGAGSGTWQAQAGNPSIQIIVSEAADFPTPVADVITLAADTVYLIDGDIDVGNDRFVFSSNSIIRGINHTVSSITSTTSSNLFTSSANFHIEDVAINATNATLFSCTGGATELAHIHDVCIEDVSSLGTFTSWSKLYVTEVDVQTTTTGLSFSGSCGDLEIDHLRMVSGYTTGIDLDAATFDVVSIRDSEFKYASATSHIDIAANSANINSGKFGVIGSCVFDTGATNIINNYDRGDLQWLVSNNTGIPGTSRDAQGYMHTTTVTTIGAGDGDSGNPKLVNSSTNFVDAVSDQFTISTGGRFTYVGIEPDVFIAQVGFSGTTSASTDTLNHYIAKNGTVITASRARREYTSTAVGSPAPCYAIVELDTNDYLELFVENTTGTNNWSSESINFTIVKRG